MNSTNFMSLSSSSISGSAGPTNMGPFRGLVICVTGLSKEARQQIMVASERLGGHYSSSLNPSCTHLVVQSCVGRKFEHALKHGQRNGLFVVTLGWFVDSVRKNVRMSESRYIIKNVGESRFSLVKSDGFLSLPGIEKSCLPMALHGVDKSSDVNNTSQLSKQSLWKEYNNGSLFSNDFIFIDTDISAELKKKVVDAASREGAKFLDHWFLGSPASHVVCDSSSIKKYIGHADTLVTPHWIFKTVKERCLQRLVRLSSDLVRQVANILENDQINQIGEDAKEPGQTFLHSTNSYVSGNLKISLEDRRKYIEFAKLGVRNRRSRCMQENLTAVEIEAAIHTDSRHADRLRALYASAEAMIQDFVPFPRIDFLGSRRFFEALKRSYGPNSSSCYELLLRA